MKDLRTYYCCILSPFVLLIMAANANLVSNNWFVILLFSYFLFRQFTDTWRLRAIGVIKKRTLNTILDPFLQAKYFTELYLGKSNKFNLGE